jgi:antitoxin component of MazEF toxin-antitoxin module
MMVIVFSSMKEPCVREWENHTIKPEDNYQQSSRKTRRKKLSELCVLRELRGLRGVFRLWLEAASCYTYTVITQGANMLRKVFRTGNSLVISLPKDVIEPLGVTEGGHVSVELDRPNRQIVIRPVELPFAGTIDEGFARQVAEFIEEYRPALEALAGK